MKYFQNKKALTLVELIISVLITGGIIIIVMTFMTKSIDELRITNQTTKVIDTSFTIKDKMTRFIKGGYNTFNVYGLNGENNSVVLQNGKANRGVLFGVINGNTNKIQKDKIYDSNFIGYKLLSEKELLDIGTNSGVIYDYIFPNDKIYKDARVKDFIAELYNGGAILDIYLSNFLVIDENHFGEKIADLFFNKSDILEFNFDF